MPKQNPTMLMFHPFMLLVIAGYGSSEILFGLEGSVQSEKYNYYKVFHPGNIQLVLDTLVGDADLYVTSKDAPPTFDPETFDFQSATCGLDIVDIPKNARRPLAVGVYGHFSYNHSDYTLEVIQLPDEEDYFNEIREEIVGDPEHTRKRTVSKVKSKLKNIPHSLWPFLELFEILFL